MFATGPSPSFAVPIATLNRPHSPTVFYCSVFGATQRLPQLSSRLSEAATATMPNLFMSSASVTPLQALLSYRSHLAATLFSAQVYYHLIETLFFATIIYLALTRAYKPWVRNAPASLTPAQQAAKLAAWKPEPLAPPLPESVTDALPLDLTLEAGGAGPHLHLVGRPRPVLNLCTTNFLGLLKHPRVTAACEETLARYGCGACGPRGFYGTTDLHLSAERRLAAFCDTDDAILYSFGAATSNSTIPAFVKRGDLLVVDDAISYTVLLGVRLSRATVLRFRHNDMNHLEEVLASVTEADQVNPARARTQRRLVVVEGIYSTTGSVCPLDRVVALKNRFAFRVMLDESFSLGVLGATGRGALEHFGLPRSAIDITTADVGHAIATVGGFCVGDNQVVSHQRLSGAGYCFSASQPPFLATAAVAALDVLNSDSTRLLRALRTNIAAFRSALDIPTITDAGWHVDGDPAAPLLIVRRENPSDRPGKILIDVQRHCLDRDVLIGRPAFAPDDPAAQTPVLRATLSAALPKDEVVRAAGVFRDALLSVADIHA